MINNIDEYVDFTHTTAIYPEDVAVQYVYAGLIEEVGEVAGIFKRWVRDEDKNESAQTRFELKENFTKELGDVLWYTARYCVHNNINIQEEVMFAYDDWDAFSTGVELDLSIDGIGDAVANMSNATGIMVTTNDSDDAKLGMNSLLFEVIYILNKFGLTMKDCYQVNYEKLSSRKQRGVIKGKGDDR
jgi:NTP pyrophosphatase (non-canonical NTP hydrolase)